MRTVSAAQDRTWQGKRRLRELSLGGCALALLLVAQDAGPHTATALVAVPMHEAAPDSGPDKAIAPGKRLEGAQRRISFDAVAESKLANRPRASAGYPANPGAAEARGHRVPVQAALTPPLAPIDRPIELLAQPPARAIPSRIAPATEAGRAIGSEARVAVSLPREEPAPAPRAIPVRPDAYIAQIAPDRASDTRTLTAATEAMQVSPDLALAKMERGRVAMLATAPARLTLRTGNGTAGEVAVAMLADDTIGVRLADLLDIVGPQMDAERLATLRASSSAQTFVTLDQLRAAELTISYDPVYDELRLKG